MSCMLEYPGLREPAMRFAARDVVCVVGQPGEAQATPGEQKVWSQSETSLGGAANLASIEQTLLLQHSSCIGYIRYFVRLLFYSPLHCIHFPLRRIFVGSTTTILYIIFYLLRIYL